MEMRFIKTSIGSSLVALFVRVGLYCLTPQAFTYRRGASRLFSQTKGSMYRLLLPPSRSALNARSIDGSTQRFGHEARQLSEGTLSAIEISPTISTKDRSNGMNFIEIDRGISVPSFITEVSESAFVEHGR